MTTDSPNPLDWIDAELAELDRQGLRRQLRPCDEAAGTLLTVDGQRLVNFASNDYLGLAHAPSVIAAVQEAVARAGVGAGASPLVTGYRREQALLEAELADFLGCERAVVFSSGYAANVGTITALVGSRDGVFGDKLNHASLIDGCQLSGAYFRTYRHGDLDHLAHHLQRSRDRTRRRLIVTDSVFSMDGTLAPLAELVELAGRHGAMLLVDEAHATGVFGPQGQGLAHQLGVAAHVTAHVGTLSKALGSSGGFVAGSEKLCTWLVNKSRSLIYSTALTLPALAAARASLADICQSPARGHGLQVAACELRTRLSEQGWNLGGSACQIIPLIVGSSEAALELAAYLRHAGFLVPAIRPPTVPPGTARLRLSLSSAHAPEQVDGLLAVLARWQQTIVPKSLAADEPLRR